MSSLSEYDLVFNGDFNKWVKFANSLKLRMAMRISSVSPALAKEKAEEAVSDVIGVMTSASDAAYSKYNDGMIVLLLHGMKFVSVLISLHI